MNIELNDGAVAAVFVIAGFAALAIIVIAGCE